MARTGLSDEVLKQRAIEHEVERMMRHIAWLHPALAQEVLRRCRQKVDSRAKSGATTVVSSAHEVI